MNNGRGGGGRRPWNGRRANVQRNVAARDAAAFLAQYNSDEDEEDEEGEEDWLGQMQNRYRRWRQVVRENADNEGFEDEEQDGGNQMMMQGRPPDRRAVQQGMDRDRARQQQRVVQAEDPAREQARHQQRQGAGRGAPPPQIQRGPVRPLRDPSGNIRYANRQLRSAVSWMFTLHLSGDPRRVNYFPSPPNVANLAVDQNTGDFVRPYVVPTVQQLFPRPNAPIYIVYQLEQGNNGAVDDNGVPIHHNGLHYQGYMEFGSKVSAIEICTAMQWTEAAGWNMADIWLEPRAGRREDAIRYVTKDDTAVDIDPLLRDFAHGILDSEQLRDAVDEVLNVDDQALPLAPMRPTSGEPRPPDAAEISKAVEAMINEGASYLDIFKVHPAYALSHPTGIKTAIAAVADATGGILAHRDVKTFVFWGDSRTGKTRRIAELEGDRNLVMDKNKVYIKNRTEQYYQHYTNQEVLVLDEFTGSLESKMTIADFCAILDGSNLSLPIKYESPRFAKWTRVYITSNIAPRRWFPNASPEQIDAMYNRLNTGGIIKFVNTAKPASVAAHQAELDSQTYLADRPTVIMKDATAW